MKSDISEFENFTLFDLFIYLFIYVFVDLFIDIISPGMSSSAKAGLNEGLNYLNKQIQYRYKNKRKASIYICKPVSVKRRLQTADCRLQTRGKMQTEGKMQTADCRPGVKCRLNSKTA